MKKFYVFFALLCTMSLSAQTEPIFYESFDRCIDEDDENYGYTGGNDGQWSGNVGTAIVIYEDNQGWTDDYANGAYQCVKVGTSTKQGWITTPNIACSGDVVLTFRVAPWEGDKYFRIEVTGGTPDKSSFELEKNKWNDLTVNVSDVKSGIQVKFTSSNKHRFFLDEVKVFPADPNKPAIRLLDGTSVDFGYVGKNYKALSHTITVRGENLVGEITATCEEGDADFFTLSPATLPAEGGDLTITFKSGASSDYHGTYLKLRGKDASNNTIERTVSVAVEVGTLSLEGDGTKENPYTIADRIVLANNDGTVWSNMYYWVTGYVLGAVKRYQDAFDGVCYNDKTSLVLAATPDETDWNKMVTVQIGSEARAALNVVDNPELIGQPIKVLGILLTQKGSPLYLGKPGVREVYRDYQYVRPAKTPTEVDIISSLDESQPMYDLLGRRVNENYHGIVIQNGQKWLR